VRDKVRGKSKVFPVINYGSRHEEVQGIEDSSHTFLSLTLDGGKWSVSLPGILNPVEIAPVPIH
jgi:hypothetical protein